MRTRVFIGDIQGCRVELDALLDRIGFDPVRHEVWCVGDLVNRGPDNVGVLRRLRSIGANSVLGNHDLNLLAVASGLREPRPRDTIADVLEAPDRHELLAWLRARPLVQTWPDLVLVHAGLHPGWIDPRRVAVPLETRIRAGRLPLSEPDLRFLVGVRHCDARGRRPDDDRHPGDRYRPWDHFYRGRRTVVFGHWSMRGRVQEERIRGLDTGCVWGGALTAWMAEDDHWVRVPARRAYAKP